VAGQTVTISQLAGSCTADPPVASFSWTPDRTDIAVNEKVTFTDKSTSTVSRSWAVSQGGFDLPGTGGSGTTYTWTPSAVGIYVVHLTAVNACGATDTTTQSFNVLESVAPDVLFISGAAHTSGLKGTNWRTDLELFNPSATEPLTFDLLLLPFNEDNSDPQVRETVTLPPLETVSRDDVVAQLFGQQDVELNASVGFDLGAGGAVPVVTARTYNQTDAGTYGSFVPVAPLNSDGARPAALGGLRGDAQYHTNVMVTNLTDKPIGDVKISVFDENGVYLGVTSPRLLPAHSTIQFVKVGRNAGEGFDAGKYLPLFSAIVNAPADQVAVFGSIIDDSTGDSNVVMPNRRDAGNLYLPALAHSPGANGAFWQSDVELNNPGSGQITFKVHLWRIRTDTWVPGWANPPEITLGANQSLRYEDVLGPGGGLFSGAKSGDRVVGFLWVEPTCGSAPPLVSAKTYTTDEDGGTFGQGVAVFGNQELLYKGDTGYIAGIAESSNALSGSRTNIGFLNAGGSDAHLRLKLYDAVSGKLIARHDNVVVAPGTLLHTALTSLLPAVTGQDVNASLEIEEFDGGPVAAYVTIVDNQTNDGIFVPPEKLGQ